ncbi:MAG: DUF1553 domain-containing protein [Planctomycetaceae bacterium]
MNKFGVVCLAFVAAFTVAPQNVQAESTELNAQQVELFEIHVRPVLVTHCIKCHGDAKQEGALRLTKLEELLRGGESGPAVVPGKPEESLLLEALRYESFEMPPSGQLDDKLVAGIEAWISAGAPWPNTEVLRPISTLTEADRNWWCIQPVADAPVPAVNDNGWCKNEIDHFIFKRLAEAGLTPSESASPRVLTRRVHFTLTGLPPNPEDHAALLSQTQSGTAEPLTAELIDQLLNDPAYGENQAKYWLDLVRYADSDGYNADHARPDAAQYRDYVVRSFNEDKPYDRFVMEQLAGDEIDPGNRDAVIATMYLRHWIYEWNQRDVEGQWAEILSDVTETTSDVFLGLSFKCARCHDHKFDPLLQKDYYELLSFFAPLQPRAEMPLADLATRTEHYQKQKAWEAATDSIRQRLHEIEHQVLLKHSTREGVAKFVPEIRAMIDKRECDRSPYEQQIASMAGRQFDMHPDKLPEWLDEETEAERQELIKKLAEFDSLKPQPLPTLKFLASDVGPEAPPTYILDDSSGNPVVPGFPDIIDASPATIVPPPEALQSTGRRTALAKWLTDRNNPLTARVIVNRIWAQHFGRGLVDTVNDFGHLGTPPSHPELLDWLTTRFMEDGWSIKELHRRILSSATWQQVSNRPLTDELRKTDPTNILLWRMNPKRLSGEEIVDAMLVSSGELGSQKRALYRTVRRNTPDPQLGLFDFPDRIRSQGQRHQTTSPTQALMLLNNDWSGARAVSMYGRLQSYSDDDFIAKAYRQLYFREGTDLELAAAKEFLSIYESATPEEKRPSVLAEMPNGMLGVNLIPENKTKIQVPYFDELPNGDFTIEATVMLRSLYPDASVRTIAAQWNSNNKEPGWSLGVTSTKSAYKPMNVILQLVGDRGNGMPEYEVIASDLRMELNKPYFVAVSVDLDDTSESGITFYLKDLSTPDAEMQKTHVKHQAQSDIRSKRPVDFGGRAGSHLWDGLIHNVRLHNAALSDEQLSAADSSRLLFDSRFVDDSHPGRDVSPHNHHASLETTGTAVRSPQQRARIALLHALLNSNEMIYVD